MKYKNTRKAIHSALLANHRSWRRRRESGQLTVWEQAEINTIQEIICRAHPDGAEAIERFWAWYESEEGKWIGPHRACGAWLLQQITRRLLNANIERHDHRIKSSRRRS